ncbi:MAG TPA: acyltransferase [Candidatus Methylacidiphilales bacterium]
MERKVHFDALRGIAALVVVFSHVVCLCDWGLLDGDPAHSYFGWEGAVARSPLNLLYQGGGMVEIFFVLSGYVLVPAFLGRNTFAGALARRYVRLAGVVACACLFAWVVIALGLDFSREILTRSHSIYLEGADHVVPRLGFGGLLKQAFVTSFIRPGEQQPYLGGVLWTMPTEFFGSIFILVAMQCYRWRPALGMGCLAFLTVAWFGYSVFYMLVGAWIGLAALRLGEGVRLPFPGGKAGLAVVVVVALYLLSFMGSPEPGPLYGWLYFDIGKWHFFHFNHVFRFLDVPLFWRGVGATLLVWAVAASPRLQGFLDRFEFLGKISFPLYLTHNTVLFGIGAGGYLLLRPSMPSPLATVAVVFPVAVVASLAVAWVAYLYVEKPVIALSRRVGEKVDGWFRRGKIGALAQ